LVPVSGKSGGEDYIHLMIALGATKYAAFDGSTIDQHLANGAGPLPGDGVYRGTVT
jgi:hypothetical protein